MATVKVPVKYKLQFENETCLQNILRIRVILYTILVFTAIVLISKFALLYRPATHSATKYLYYMNAFHFFFIYILLKILSKIIPNSWENIRSVHKFLELFVPLSILVYYAVYSAILDWSLNSPAVYIISTFGLASFLILKNRWIIFLFIVNSTVFISVIIILKKGNISFIENYIYVIALIIIAWVTSRVFYQTYYSNFIKKKRFEQINIRLKQEVDERKKTEQSLKKVKNELEMRVESRTDELSIINLELESKIKENKKALKIKKELEEKLIRSEKMEVVGKLAGGVAHDLNNLLSAIINYPELLLMKMPENSPHRRMLEIMKHSGQKAATIVKDLLTLARRGVVRKDPVNINEVITRYLLSPEYERLQHYHPNIRLNNFLSESVSNIEGSFVHLEKTVMNLISNAVEAMENAGTISIRTSNRLIKKQIPSYDQIIKKGNYVVLTVSDQGTGISDNEKKRIFEPFYTKKEMGRSGTGLGLTVVWNTVKDHNGFINIESRQGIGTTFELLFPASDKKIRNKVKDINMEEYIGNDEKILVVDDIYEQREIVNSILSMLGYSVSSVSSGEAAIEYLKKKSVDLILLDMIMDPGIDGYETYKQLKKIAPEIKVIIASGYSETGRVKDTLKMGALQYIQKPYTLDKIGAIVKESLNSK